MFFCAVFEATQISTPRKNFSKKPKKSKFCNFPTFSIFVEKYFSGRPNSMPKRLRFREISRFSLKITESTCIEALGPPGSDRAWNCATRAFRHASAKIGPPGRGRVWNCPTPAFRHASAELGAPGRGRAWSCAAPDFRHTSAEQWPPGLGRAWNCAPEAFHRASAQLGTPGRGWAWNCATQVSATRRQS